MSNHPLYKKCLGMRNKKVTVHHVRGHKYHGTLHHVSSEGIYLIPHHGTQPISNEETDLQAQTTEQRSFDKLEPSEVFYPFFFPFAALAGLTIGFAAGVALSRPYYPYY